MAESIHNSHSKKTLCEIIEIFNLNIVDYKKLNKQQLSKKILYGLSVVEVIPEDNDFYFIKNKIELIDYLINPDSSKTLTVKQKEEVMELAKYIIMYCKNGYYLSHSPFIDFDEMVEKAIYISNYGDIPSVRKAVDSLNKDVKLINKIKLIMSSKCKKKLQRKKRLKQKFQGGLTVKRGCYIITFD